MAKDDFKHVTIIGVGLLGGSIALAMRKRWPAVEIAGVGRRESSLLAAKQRGAIDTMHLDAAEAVGRSDLVILATPVGAFASYLRAIKPHLKRGAIVTDVGSTKALVVRQAERILGKGGAFVGSHPMAGNEKKGPQFATAELVAGAKCIVTPTASTPPAKVRRVLKLWSEIGMETVKMSPATHDRATARVSHVPHVVSALLMCQPSRDDLSVAATGLRDTTRLAGGDPEMWRDILTTNRSQILRACDKFARDLQKVRDMVEADDAQAIEKFFAKAKRLRDEAYD